MTDPATQPPPCRFEDCYEPVFADHICREHHEAFHGPTTHIRALPDALPTPRAPVAPTGRLRLSPMFALVGTGPDDAVGAVYGVYGSGELAENAAGMIGALGIPARLQIVPFYEVTP